MNLRMYREEYIRGLNILHLVKKISGISETEIKLDDLDLESFFCGENLGGLPFWAEVSERIEEGCLIQSPSDVYRLFSELFEVDEFQEEEKALENEMDWIQRASEAAGLFLNLSWYKVMAPKEYYAAMFAAFVCYELEYELLYAEEGKIRKELTECLDYIKEYGLSEENGDDYLAEEAALLELALECRQKGIAILPPDINLSEPFEFHVEEGGIRIPFDFPYRELAWPDISRICERRKERPFRSEKEVKEFLSEHAFCRLSNNGSFASVSTVFSGWEELDKELGGFQAGNLYYVAGRPGMGTTTFLKKLASSISGNQKKVRYYCMDEPVWDQEEEGIFVNEVGNNFLDLEKMIREDVRPQIIMVDGFLCLFPYPGYHGAVSRKEINRRMKSMAQDLGLPIIVTASVRRNVEAREDHRPKLGDVFGLEGGRQYVDGVFTLFRENYYDPDGSNLLEVEILKNPLKKTGRFTLNLEEEGDGNGVF